tara:strand:+ start:2776 stop:3243 length:468 start_codon:yes stop_codon:yes gene_type:complete
MKKTLLTAAIALSISVTAAAESTKLITTSGNLHIQNSESITLVSKEANLHVTASTEAQAKAIAAIVKPYAEANEDKITIISNASGISITAESDVLAETLAQAIKPLIITDEMLYCGMVQHSYNQYNFPYKASCDSNGQLVITERATWYNPLSWFS